MLSIKGENCDRYKKNMGSFEIHPRPHLTLPQPVFRIPAAIPLRVNKAPCNNSPLL